MVLEFILVFAGLPVNYKPIGSFSNIIEGIVMFRSDKKNITVRFRFVLIKREKIKIKIAEIVKIKNFRLVL